MSDIPDMVERVARALVPDAWHETEYPHGRRFTLVLWEEEQARARKLARIAIGAMRHSSRSMWKQGAQDIDNYSLREGSSAEGHAAYVFQRMIDAALAEQSS